MEIDKNLPNIARNMKAYRATCGFSQNKLSEVSGVAYNTIIKIESGANTNPTIDTLSKIARALEVGVDDLIQ
jgi:DNA-binding XRE family transcriptional regulator